MAALETISQTLFLQFLQIPEFMRTPHDWCEQEQKKQIDRASLIDTTASRQLSMN